MTLRVKICGVRDPADAALAAALGATHVGCVLAGDSPRCATFPDVSAVRNAVGTAAEVVLVFRNANEAEVAAACDATGVDTVQPHGAAEELCLALERRGLRVLRVHRVAANARALPELVPAQLAVLDHGDGGSGRRFRWDLLGERAPDHVLVAGGITPDNVAELLRRRPFGIDVSSGVEAAPGRKDHGKLRALFAACAAGGERP